MKKASYEELLTDWVLKFGDPYLGPNHSQFSAAEVANIIIQYNRDKLSGKIKMLSKKE